MQGRSSARPACSMEVYAIKVTLLGTRPPVWRRILIDRDITLRNLHLTLQTVMGWENSHLHEFVLPRLWNRRTHHGSGTKILNESRVSIGDVIAAAGQRLLYEYDFGDGWQHELVLEEVLLGDESYQPMCLGGERCCPPEDCGGPLGFAGLLEAIADLNHPDHDNVCAWLGGFAPESFSKEAINRQLARKRSAKRRAAGR